MPTESDPDQLPEAEVSQTEPPASDIQPSRNGEYPTAGEAVSEPRTGKASSSVTSGPAAAEDSCAVSSGRLGSAVHAGDTVAPVRIPGPGPWAALVWTLSIFVFHLLGILISGVVLFAFNVEVLQEIAADPQLAKQILEPFLKDRTFFLIGGEMLVFVLIAMIAARWQHGPQMARILGLRRIPLPALILIVSAVVPVSLLCSGLHEKALPVWEYIADRAPALDVFSEMNVNQQLGPLSESVPAWALLLVIAVAPAIGEELIFRGIIGHGLVARYGIRAGVLLTSMYFAIVHIHPAHVLTLMPLALFLHISWLATRSFYAPVLIHFLNNALAVFVLKNAAQLKEAARVNNAEETGWLVILLAALVLIPAVLSLWRNRIEYRLHDESRWTPGYDTAGMPPDGIEATAVMEVRDPWLYGTGILLCGGLTLVCIFETLNALR